MTRPLRERRRILAAVRSEADIPVRPDAPKRKPPKIERNPMDTPDNAPAESDSSKSASDGADGASDS